MNRSRKMLREVLPPDAERVGRWFLPYGRGYTDDIAEAGVFDSVASTGNGHGVPWRQIDAATMLRGELAAVEERAVKIALLLEEATR